MFLSNNIQVKTALNKQSSLAWAVPECSAAHAEEATDLSALFSPFSAK